LFPSNFFLGERLLRPPRLGERERLFPRLPPLRLGDLLLLRFGERLPLPRLLGDRLRLLRFGDRLPLPRGERLLLLGDLLRLLLGDLLRLLLGDLLRLLLGDLLRLRLGDPLRPRGDLRLLLGDAESRRPRRSFGRPESPRLPLPRGEAEPLPPLLLSRDSSRSRRRSRFPLLELRLLIIITTKA